MFPPDEGKSAAYLFDSGWKSDFRLGTRQFDWSRQKVSERQKQFYHDTNYMLQFILIWKLDSMDSLSEAVYKVRGKQFPSRLVVVHYRPLCPFNNLENNNPN